MTVLPGEGTHPILYGSFWIQSGLRGRPAYLARPDLGGRFPGLVVAHDGEAVSAGAKAVCRAFARHGYAVVAPQLLSPDRDDRGGALAALTAGFEFLAGPDTPWARSGRIGVVAIGAGGIPAVHLAAGRAGVGALVLFHALLDPSLGEVEIPILGLYGRDDELVPPATLAEAGRSHPAAEWVIYAGVGHDFLDDASTSYHDSAARDAVQRALGFLGGRLAADAAA